MALAAMGPVLEAMGPVQATVALTARESWAAAEAAAQGH
jgi:hypothetical protein